MKILQLGKFYPVRGGIEKVMYDLMNGLSAQGIECDMLCAAYGHKGRTIEVRKNARVISCLTWFRLFGTMIPPGLILKAMRICREYDIIHIHHPDPMACVALWCSGYKGKVILHWHSDIIKQRISLRYYLPLQRWLLRRADLILGTTPVYLNGSSCLKTAQEKCMPLPIGITPVPPSPEKEQILRSRYEGKKIIFALGRLVYYKGFTHLIAAATYLPDDYMVLIGGDGPLRYDLEAEIETQGVENKVRCLGRIHEEDLPAYYHACTLFCLPSVQKTEAFGIVQIEAMSCGKPVVATDIPGSGVSWVNAHGISGLNVPVGDPKALARAIMDITCDDDTYRRYSQNALDRYRTVFTLDRMICGIRNCYEKTCMRNCHQADRFYNTSTSAG